MATSATSATSATRRRVAAATVAACWCLLASAGASAQAAALVWPSEPLVLTAGDAGFTTSVTVVNPTDGDAQVAVDPARNACAVGLRSGPVTVLARRSTALAFTVSPAPRCADPADGSHVVVLTATATGSPPHDVSLPIKKSTAAAEPPKATGLVWPDKPVFLQRTSNGLEGSFLVVNPTIAAIMVTPPSFGEGCEQAAPSTAKTVSAAPKRATTVTIEGPTDCDELSVRDLVVTASAVSADGTKVDTQKLTLQAEVAWAGFWPALGASAALATVIAALTLLLHERDPDKRTGLKDPLLIDSSSPTSWLTGVATVGSLLSTLVSTSGLAKALLGTETIPQSALTVAAAAISVALIAAAGVVAGIPAKTRIVDGEEQGCPIIGQFAFAAAMTAAAAGFQVWAVRAFVEHLDVASPPALNVLAVACALGIAVYLVWSLHYYVNRYADPRVKAAVAPDGALVAAVASALTPHFDADEAGRTKWKAAAEAAVAAAREVAAPAPAPAPGMAAPPPAPSAPVAPPQTERQVVVRPARFARRLI